MERSLTFHSPDVIKAIIARSLLADVGSARLGAIRLRPHQRAAVARIREMLHQLGGALLADEAGLGKTYVALTLASEAKTPLLVAPAALIPMWRAACASANVSIPDVSYEALSRGRTLASTHDLIVLDEAHHARTPSTRRYTQLSAIACRARVLLVSASPIHNRRGDLAALLALFLGARAWTLDDDELARFVVRREHATVRDIVLPALSATEMLQIGDDESTLEAIVALPAPLPPRDGGDGGSLLAMSLVRQWASSDAALIGALRHRLARASSLIHALENGRYPTRRELAAWAFAQDSVQLAFPELIASAFDEPSRSIASLLTTVRAHAAGVRTLIARVTSRPTLDVQRAERLREVRCRHPGAKIIAFAQFTDTVRAYFEALRPDGGVAALTGRGGVVSGGKLSRSELLSRFAPRATGKHAPSDAERIDVLITTDLLSEGVNLQDASIIVHLDLPWTPARLEQRVGRSRRIGATHARTFVYALEPPASAAAMTRIEERLRDKLRAASDAVGAVGMILPWRASADRGTNMVARREALYARLANGRRDLAVDTHGSIAIGACASRRNAVLALIVDDGEPMLIGSLDGSALTDDPERLLQIIDLTEDEMIPATPVDAAQAIENIDEWSRRRRGAKASGVELSITGSVRRQAMRRVTQIATRLPMHRRAALLPLAARARQAIATQFGIGGERVLAELAAAPMPDDAWLRALGAFGETIGASRTDVHSSANLEIVAVLLMQADSN